VLSAGAEPVDLTRFHVERVKARRASSELRHQLLKHESKRGAGGRGDPSGSRGVRYALPAGGRVRAGRE
jgi:hypothetical protein